LQQLSQYLAFLAIGMDRCSARPGRRKLSPGARGVFTWTEWAAALAVQIKRAQAAGDADTGETYYRYWLAPLENLVTDKGVCTVATLRLYRDAWDHAAWRDDRAST
jgi:nitrile hydratase accessory protein